MELSYSPTYLGDSNGKLGQSMALHLRFGRTLPSTLAQVVGLSMFPGKKNRIKVWRAPP